MSPVWSRRFSDEGGRQVRIREGEMIEAEEGAMPLPEGGQELENVGCLQMLEKARKRLSP